MDPRSLTAKARETARATWTGVRSSPFDVPPESAKLARFVFGFHLIFGLLGLLLRNPVDRTRYLRVVTLQVLATLATAVVLAWAAPSLVSFAVPKFADSLDDSAHERRARRAAERAREREEKRALATAEDASAKGENERKRAAKRDAKRDGADAGADKHGTAQIVVNGIHITVPKKYRDEAQKSIDEQQDEDGDDDDGDDGDDDKEPAANGAKGPPAPHTPLTTARHGLLMVIRAYASIVVAQWIVVALSRDFHDELGDRAAEQSGLPPLPEPPPPARVRVNVKWMRKRVRDRIRAALAFAAGIPAITLFLIPLSLGAAFADGWSERTLERTSSFAHGALTFAWGAYWLAVSVCAKSPHAFRVEGEPWFFRADSHSLARVPVIGWVVRVYARVTRRLTRPLAGPAVCAERASYESMGLAVAQVIVSLPLVRLGGRIVVPVAASHIVLRALRARPVATASSPPAPPPFKTG